MPSNESVHSGDEKTASACNNAATQTDCSINSFLFSLQDRFLRCVEEMEQRAGKVEEEDEEGIYEEVMCSDSEMPASEFLFMPQPSQALELEEVILKRTKSCRQLGLTLCYGSVTGGDENSDTNIFIGNVERGSVAEREGRIHVGDQILQINGISIHCRKDAIHEFSKPSDQIVLLLARAGQDSGLSRGTDSDAEVHNAVTQTADRPSAKMFMFRASQPPAKILEQSLEQELSQLHLEMENIRMECDRLMRSKAQTAQPITLPPKSQVKENQQPQFGAFLRQQQPPPNNPQLVNKQWAMKSPPMERKFVLPPPLTNRGLWVGGRRQPSDEVQEASSSAYNTGGDSCRSTPMKGDFASQYNNSISTNGYGVPQFPPRRPLRLTTAEKRINVQNVPPPHIIYSPTENPYHTIETPTSVAPNQSQQQPVQFRLPKLLVNFNPAESQLQQPSRMMMQRNSHTGIPAQSAQKEVNTRHTMSKNGIIFRPGDMMYTSPDNLAETIALQQRLLRQTMIEQANIIGAAAAASGVDNLRVQSGKHSATQQKRNENVRAKHCVFETQSNSQNGNNKGDLDQYEWKVKRRADGTRYITRRPLKSRILKAREEQVNKERLGVSTDDDAASELKAGKFWSREERKRHLERAKERKQRHNRMLNEREQANSTDKEILQLSQRKQQRKNSRQLFDRFTTIQEFLAHGVRDPTTHPVGGILSVTTV
ncbi:PDZ domain (Also known as DHR or GLGF) domain-containing protein [Ditylenchus destructor]|nr:PDZ domain (Also known as DHR or GLGF) domain-containing protein [Ditylenchus destructor]